MTDTELAWMGGFFSGEGSILAQPRHGRYSLSLTMGNTNRDALERFRAAFGGNYTERPEMARRSMFWYWRLTRGEDVRAALDALWPWLTEEKREQARRAFVKVAASRPSRRVERAAMTAYCLAEHP